MKWERGYFRDILVLAARPALAGKTSTDLHL
jgi:hypothetical protein